MKIFWSAQARGDLRAIRNFIARDSEHYEELRIVTVVHMKQRITRRRLR